MAQSASPAFRRHALADKWKRCLCPVRRTAFKLHNGETDSSTLPDHAGEEYHPAVAGGRRRPVRRRGGTIIRTGTGTECDEDQPQ